MHISNWRHTPFNTGPIWPKWVINFLCKQIDIQQTFNSCYSSWLKESPNEITEYQLAAWETEMAKFNAINARIETLQYGHKYVCKFCSAKKKNHFSCDFFLGNNCYWFKRKSRKVIQTEQTELKKVAESDWGVEKESDCRQQAMKRAQWG